MLDDFKNNNFYEYAKGLDKYFHAYIFEVEDNTSYNMILAFAKMIICNKHFTNNKNCLDCNICHLIDENYYEDLIVIEPDGKLIKKEQITDLQEKLSLKSSNDNNQVYIIKDADKMNLNSSNSLLKFIEEPENNIYAILITNNIKDIIETIRSRCQIINIKSSSSMELDENNLNSSLDFLNLIFKYKEDAIAYLKQDFFNTFKDRTDILNCFQYLIIILDKEINHRYGKKDESFQFYDIINSSLSNYSLSDLLFYLDKIIEYKNILSNNPYLNINLFMDRFIIDISKVVLK